MPRWWFRGMQKQWHRDLSFRDGPPVGVGVGVLVRTAHPSARETTETRQGDRGGSGCAITAAEAIAVREREEQR